jgi:outer membrane protein OmpA-like peptidoglycan-associated protein
VTASTRDLKVLLIATCVAVAASVHGARAQATWGGGARSVTGHSVTLDVRETAEAFTINLAADVLFDFDKANFKAEAEDTLRKAVTVIRGRPGTRVLVGGHTDSVGTADHNRRLSEARAESVKAWLVRNRHIPAERIETRGWAATRPVAPNTNADGSDNPAGRRKNRRVEIRVDKR